jgi:hypothetical protein
MEYCTFRRSLCRDEYPGTSGATDPKLYAIVAAAFFNSTKNRIAWDGSAQLHFDPQFEFPFAHGAATFS